MAKVLRSVLVFVFWLIIHPAANGQSISFEDLRRLQLQERRPVIVFIHTTWCRYCSAMDNSLHNNNALSRLITQKFYLVKLDGEEKNPIRFAGRDFYFKPTGNNTGVHDLATELGTVNGQLSYPTICLLDENNQITYQYPGFLNAGSLLELLSFISGK